MQMRSDMKMVKFAIKHGEKVLDDFNSPPSDLDLYTYIKYEGYQYKVPNSKMCELFRKCKKCLKDISHKHPNSKFCKSKCKDKFHNSQPARLECSKKYAPKVTKTITVKVSKLSELLDTKINHPFAGMTKYGDQ